jgi:peptide/nickel transport system permease protein
MSLAPTLPTPVQRGRNRAWAKFKRNRAALVGLVIVTFFVLLAALAPLLPIADPLATSWTAIRKPPSADFWMGTDDLGRDIVSRMIWGAQASLAAGIVSVTIALCIGLLPAISAAGRT